MKMAIMTSQMLMLLLAGFVSSGDLVVRNVRKNCVNFDCLIEWDAPLGFECAEERQNESNLTYSLLYEDFNGSQPRMIPVCQHTTRCKCAVDDVDVPIYPNDVLYMFVQVGTDEDRRVEVDITPYLDVYFHPPKFEVELINGNEAQFRLVDRQLARRGSTQSLVDYLRDGTTLQPVYRIKYWKKKGGGDETGPKHIRDFSAVSPETDCGFSVKFPQISDDAGDMMCFSWSIVEQVIYTESQSLSSEPVCLKAKIPSNTAYEVLTYTGYTLACVLLLVMAVCIYKTLRKWKDKFQIIKQKSLPASLINTVSNPDQPHRMESASLFPKSQKEKAAEAIETRDYPRAARNPDESSYYHDNERRKWSLTEESTDETVSTDDTNISKVVSSQNPEVRQNDFGLTFNDEYVQFPVGVPVNPDLV